MEAEDQMDQNWMILPASAGLQQINSQNGEPWTSDFSISDILEGLDYSDFQTSPSPNNRLPFEALGYDAMEMTGTGEEAGMQMNPANLGAVSQNIPNPLNDPMFSGVPMAPQAHAVPASAANMEQSDRTDSFSEIEPMQLGSIEAREAVMADPSALRESLRSIELNAPSNPSSEGPAVAEQSQAQPDSSQTTSPNSSTGPSQEYFANYGLPEFHHIKVSVKFMSTLILEEDVKEENGCLLHYHPSDKPLIPVPDGVKRITIPAGYKDGGAFPWVKPKQERFTKWILTNFDKGVEFYTREGNLYAKRKSNTKLFWHDTDRQPGHALELKRNEETEVFNWVNFQAKLASHYSTQTVSQIKLPAIWFSFAQKWDKESSSITTKLVWARVDPIRACEMIKNVNPKVRSTEIEESLHTSMFAISGGSKPSAQN